MKEKKKNKKKNMTVPYLSKHVCHFLKEYYMKKIYIKVDIQ